MRLLSGILCLAALIGSALYGVFVGTEHAWFKGAPQIQADIQARAEASVAGQGNHPVDVRTDGRFVTLTGLADSTAEAAMLRQSAGAIDGLAWLSDEIRVLEAATPFTFSASREPDGQLVLSGHVPSEAVRERLIQHARPLFTDGGIRDRLTLAAGVPEGDWAGMVETGLTALAQMPRGEVSLSDLNATLRGAVKGEAGEQAVLSALDGAGTAWTTELDLLLPVAQPYRLRATLDEGRKVVLSGHAPDKATRTGFVAVVANRAGTVDTAEVILADGAPHTDWGAEAGAALTALLNLSAGMLDIEDTSVHLSGQVETDADLAALMPLLRPGWTHEITVRHPEPEPALSMVLTPDGTISGSTLLPYGLSSDAARTAMSSLSDLTVEQGKKPVDHDWTKGLTAVDLLLSYANDAKVAMSDGRLAVSGTLRRGLSAEGVQATLAAAAGRTWTIEADLLERPPLAELLWSFDGTGVALSGILPEGLSPDAALTLLGETASGEGLAGGGEGEAAAWSRTLSAVADGLDFFERASGRLRAGRIEMDATLKPGYPGDAITERLRANMPGGWVLDIAASETEASEGDRRISLTTGETESFRQGFWLPEFNFHVAAFECRDQTLAALEGEKILFVTGSAEIDARARAILNRLGGIAVRCLNSSALKLTIGGHTDGVGNDADNLALSQARADAVREALMARGVRAETMEAIGHGETTPVDTNDTPEGRARNRRISFDWK